MASAEYMKQWQLTKYQVDTKDGLPEDEVRCCVEVTQLPKSYALPRSRSKELHSTWQFQTIERRFRTFEM